MTVKEEEEHRSTSTRPSLILSTQPVALCDTADTESTSVSSFVQFAMSYIQAIPPHSVGMEIEIWWLA
jgi:hypothetical protein